MRRALVVIAISCGLASSAWAQTTNQLYMTGTGTGNTPVIYGNGVDTNINIGIMPKGTGSVGIGTTSPLMSALSLQVGADLALSSNWPTVWLNSYYDGTNNRYFASHGAAQLEEDYVNNGFSIWVAPTGTAGSVAPFIEPFFISGSGSVGIGTTSPGANLDLKSTSTGAAYAVRSTISGAANTGYAGYFSNTATGAVNYGIYATTASTTGWAGYFAGNIALTGTMTMSSDRRLKKHIQSLDPASTLDAIAALRPVSFNWKQNGVSDMGLIAQEAEDVYPALVTRNPNKTLALKYISLIAPMIASIQELKRREEKLEDENATLRGEFEAYKLRHPDQNGTGE